MVTTIKAGTSRKKIDAILEKYSKEFQPKGLEAYKYLGKLKLAKDPMKLQQELRNEWE
jgi:hypothetical protein